MPKSVYPQPVIDVIRRMAQNGSSNVEIAVAIGTTERRLQARMSQLGITRELNGKPRNNPTPIRVPTGVVRSYINAAQCRDIAPQKLIQLVLTRIAEDDLFTAILDDGK